MTDDKAQRMQGLEADIDARLMELWTMAWAEDARIAPVLEDEGMRDAFASFLRTAYALGYVHAIREVREGHGGELARAHGYAIP